MEIIEVKWAAYKRLFTQEKSQDNVDEKSPWKNIFITLNPTQEETLDIARKFAEKYGFSAEELRKITDLPHYDFVRDLLIATSKRFGYKMTIKIGNDVICCKRRETNVPLIEVIIVTSQEAPRNLDFYYPITNRYETANIVVSYTSEIPEEWIDEKKKDKYPSIH